ncbi:MAG TPA: SIMPL domain-containing protein [Candidatus Atribacteria bacterium]|nr:SIMPL domain-containing protein [Candidatus Atribacteria bacterium]HPT79164.1 SIMPL domain-containing protein [Candidatus Atribacteria bacterium]
MISRMSPAKRLLIYTLAAAVFIACLFLPQENAKAAGPRTVTVLGEGKVSIAPDTAYTTLGIETSGSDVHKAQSSNKAIMSDIIKALRDLGIKEKDIQTVNYSIYPEYNWQGTQNVLIGYRVSNQIRVKIEGMEKAGAALEAATARGANVVHGIQFTYSGISETYKTALEQALKDAEHKAKLLTGHFSYKNLKVIRLEEISKGSFLPGTYCRSYDACDPLQVNSGAMDVQALVKVTFEY